MSFSIGTSLGSTRRHLMVDDEFEFGDVIVCIGNYERWVVCRVVGELYELRPLSVFLNDAIDDEDHSDDCECLSKLMGKWYYVKVGHMKVPRFIDEKK